MQKFVQVPTIIQEDVLSGKLIGNDLVLYNYLLSKAGHGKPIYFSNKRIADDLGGISNGKVSASLGRLSKAKHIKRKKTANKTLTQLTTLVLDSENIYIKGKLS
jgi:hypothetical protein|tara:strand:- start:253 stop:564 length:312 start_codon:yes stop_codon:yes gene_type:complete